MEPNTAYNWHKDTNRSGVVNMMIDHVNSHCLFTPEAEARVSEISELNGNKRITFNQKKNPTKLQYLELSPQAYSLLNGFEQKGRVFQSLKYSAYMNVELLRWAMAAGITKHVTFHTGRHTFAVSLITQGVDIYTLSKLMGHSEVKTTQVYADIIDSVRKEAMHKIPDIGL